MKLKHIPYRTCLGCNAKKPKKEFFRVGDGRGAYLCQKSIECFEKAMKKNAFSRALGRKISNEEEESIKQKFTSD